MRKYSKYKASGVDWLGEIPKHWEVWKIKHTSYVKGRIGWDGLRADEFYEYEYAYLITGTDFNSGFVDWDTCYQITKERYLQDKYIQLKEDDLLITKDGTIGKTAIVKNLTGFASLNSGVFVVRPLRKYYSDFLYYILNSNVFKKFIDITTTGTTILHLYQNIFEIFAYPIPQIDEQHAIVRFLDYKTGQIDSFIANRQKQIELLKEQKAGIINKAVTKGINPKAKMKDSGNIAFGKIPENWDLMELKFVAKMMRGKFSHRPRNDERLYGGEYPFIQTGDVTKTEKYITTYKQSLNEWGYIVSKMFPKGTVVITIAANIGDIAILDFDACFPDSIVGFYPKNNKTEYLFYLLKNMKETFLSESIEGTQLNLSVDRLSSIKVAIPEPIEQQEIIDFIKEETSITDSLISKYQKQIDLMQEYRTSLISQAVTGKIDVREWQPKRKAVA